MPTPSSDSPEPDDLFRIDREIRLNEVWHEADDMAREHVKEHGVADDEVEEMRNLYLYDTSPDTSEHEILRAEGIELPAVE